MWWSMAVLQKSGNSEEKQNVIAFATHSSKHLVTLLQVMAMQSSIYKNLRQLQKL